MHVTFVVLNTSSKENSTINIKVSKEDSIDNLQNSTLGKTLKERNIVSSDSIENERWIYTVQGKRVKNSAEPI